MTDHFPPVELRVNGEQVSLSAHPATPLMYLLRNDLGCRGVRTGCSIGECGVCTIIMDGEAVRSCLTPVSEAAGSEIVTPEGLGGPEAPHPVQEAFLTEQAAQCGYCVNGMIMSVTACVQHDPGTPEDELRDVLNDHVCRCGTHDRLLRAANRAAGRPAVHGGSVIREDPLPEGSAGAAVGEVPGAVRERPEIERWIAIDGDRVEIQAGKVELGQGIRAALEQIVASQLGFPTGRIRTAPTSTASSPDQSQTSGSRSIEQAGAALAMAATAFRRVLLARAADRLGVAAEGLRLDGDGAHDRDGRSVGLAELVAEGPVTGMITDEDLPRWDAPSLGDPLPRSDLPRKLTGAAAYVHDLSFDGMVHARALLPPTIHARLEGLDADAIRAMPGVLEVVHDGQLVIVVAEREEQALRARDRMTADTTWTDLVEPASRNGVDVVRELPREPWVAHRDEDVDRELGDEPTHTAVYARGYQAHGPMAPSAAVAIDDGDRLWIWTHTQGIYPLRRELATLLDRPEHSIVVEHADGPGCYGMNLADDAAALAAIAARAMPARHVRLQFAMPDEFGWDPTGSASIAELSATLDGAGTIRAWRHEIVTDSHSTRPNGDGDRLLPAWLRANAVERPWVGVGEPGVRNARPLYDIPAVEVIAQHVRGPMRTGSLRSLGSFVNVFAAESFMDELAERAGADPVEFRLAHLRDERARRVLEVAVTEAGWTPHVGPSGRGQGVAVCRYKDTKAWAAVVADVEVDQEQGSFRVTRLLVAADAGAIVNADGLRNQLEGGALQGLSRTLFEELHLSAAGSVERDWTTYPALRFRDVPDLRVVLVDRPDQPPVGAGESSTPAIAPAVANALDDHLGVRLRTLPLTPASLERRMLEMDEVESARVLL